MHGTLTAVTLGAWGPVWGAASAARAAKPMRCAICQSETLPLADEMRGDRGNGRTGRDLLAGTPAAPVSRYTVIGANDAGKERIIWELPIPIRPSFSCVPV